MSVSGTHSRRAPTASILAVAAMTAMLVACGAERTTYWSPAQAPKQNKFAWVTYSHTVAFSRNGRRLSAFEQGRLDQFLAETDPGYGDRVVVRSRAGADDRRAAAVHEYLRRLSLQPRLVLAPLAEADVSVVIGRYLVTAPGCPDWSKPAGFDAANQPSSNLGCATVTNLGLMVADPGDLVRGGPIGPGDGEASARGIRKYRDGDTQSLGKTEIQEIGRQGGDEGGQ